MIDSYSNTPIIEATPSMPYLFGHIIGNVILPICAVLWVVLYFHGKPQMKLYTLAMIFAFTTLPSWLVVVIGFALILSDKIEQYFKKEHGTN